jgi:hypothetical protein
LPANPFSIIEIIQRQPGLKCLKKICHRRLPVQWSIANLFQSVLPPHSGPKLILEEPSHPYFLPLVEQTIVRLPHPFGKLLQGEFGLLQADWRFTFCTAQVRQIIALIICILIIIGYLGQWGKFYNPCNICFPQFRWRLELFCWESNWESPRSVGKRFRWRIKAGRCWPIDWMGFRRTWRHSRCTWR